MINNDRIVPITSMDFLSLIGTVLKISDYAYTVLQGENGVFTVTENVTYLCNEPAKRIIVGSPMPPTGLEIFFVADYDFEGLFDAETGEAMPTSEGIKKDGITLYKMDDEGLTQLTPDPDTSGE